LKTKRKREYQAFDGVRIRTAARRLSLALKARIEKCDEQKVSKKATARTDENQKRKQSQTRTHLLGCRHKGRERANNPESKRSDRSTA
jgi:hypothetical protein